MKRWVLLGFFLSSPLISGAAAGAEYQVGERHKNDYIWLQLNFYSMIDAANAFGPTYKLSYLELEGGGRSSFLDLYYFFDINEIFGWGDFHEEAGNFFTKVKPRFSLDSIFARDLSVGPVREWYLATQYKGFNGGEYYYAGVGIDLDVPGVDVLGLCFWPQFLRTGEGVNFEYTGLQASLNWYTLLFELPWESTLTYQGWLDYGFLNYWGENRPGGTYDEFQMFNGFFLNKDRFSLSFSLKFYYHFTYYDTNNANQTTLFFGLHYRL